MGLAEWFQQFRELHEKAKQGALGPRELETYTEARDEFARVLLSAQHLTVPAGESLRSTLRVTRAIPAEVEFRDRTERVVTLQISAGGFGTLLSRSPPVGDEVTVTLRVPGGDPLRCSARVVYAQQQAGTTRASFQFLGLGHSDVERLEQFVLDAIFAQLRR
jgi:hypothetical protein